MLIFLMSHAKYPFFFGEGGPFDMCCRQASGLIRPYLFQFSVGDKFGSLSAIETAICLKDHYNYINCSGNVIPFSSFLVVRLIQAFFLIYSYVFILS